MSISREGLLGLIQSDKESDGEPGWSSLRTMNGGTGVRANLGRVQARIVEAARRAGRDPAGIRLICVTKGISAERIQEAVACGVREIGENRVQEAQAKRPLIQGQVQWHLVGYLQRNKAKVAVTLFDWIHSVDSVPLVEALERQAVPGPKPLEVLIQVNVSGEGTKHGCKPAEVEDLAGAVLQSRSLRWAGLMTMAPFSEDPESSRPFFRRLRVLRDTLEERFSNVSGMTPSGSLHLSMGMSQDFEVAVEEGATMVRIGTAIFGPGDHPT
jgi:pyridoxal phosphate enzyme (YggS family)